MNNQTPEIMSLEGTSNRDLESAIGLDHSLLLCLKFLSFPIPET